MKKTLAIFSGLNEISKQDTQKLEVELVEFFTSVKIDIEKIIYGGSMDGIMGIVYESAKKSGVNIEGYSLEKYRKYEEGQGVNMKFFENDDIRMENFYKDGNIFLALPGGFGTLREVLTVNEFIKRNNCGGTIYIHYLFKSFYNFVSELENENMIAKEDKENIKQINDFNKIRI